MWRISVVTHCDGNAPSKPLGSENMWCIKTLHFRPVSRPHFLCPAVLLRQGLVEVVSVANTQIRIAQPRYKKDPGMALGLRTPQLKYSSVLKSNFWTLQTTSLLQLASQQLAQIANETFYTFIWHKPMDSNTDGRAFTRAPNQICWFASRQLAREQLAIRAQGRKRM